MRDSVFMQDDHQAYGERGNVTPPQSPMPESLNNKFCTPNYVAPAHIKNFILIPSGVSSPHMHKMHNVPLQNNKMTVTMALN